MSQNEENNNNQNNNNQTEQLTDMPLNDEQAEQAKGGSLKGIWGGSGSESYQQSMQRWD